MRNENTNSRLISSVIFAATIGTIGTAGTTAPETFQLFYVKTLKRSDKTMAKLDFHIFNLAQFRVEMGLSCERTMAQVWAMGH